MAKKQSETAGSAAAETNGTTERAPRPRRTRDPEIAAMEGIQGLLEALDLEARQRVLSWANRRFGRMLSPAVWLPQPTAPAGVLINNDRALLTEDDGELA